MSGCRRSPSAWNWAAAGTWIADRTTVDVNALQGEINRHRGPHPASRCNELAAIRAWSHAVAPTRLSPRLARQPRAVRRTGPPLRQGHRQVPRAAPGRDPRRHGPLPTSRPGLDHADLPDRRAAADRAGHVRRRHRRRGVPGRPRGHLPAVPRTEDRRDRRRQAGLTVRRRRRPAAAARPRQPVPLRRPVQGHVAGPATQPVRRGQDALRRHAHPRRAPPLRPGDHRLLEPHRLRARRRAPDPGPPVRRRPARADQAVYVADGYERARRPAAPTRPRSTPSSTRSRSASPTRATTG